MHPFTGDWTVGKWKRVANVARSCDQRYSFVDLLVSLQHHYSRNLLDSRRLARVGAIKNETIR